MSLGGVGGITEPTFKFWEPPRISRMAEANDFKFYTHM